MILQKVEEMRMKKTIYENEEWLGKEPQIGQEMIGEHVKADIIVVGAGIAGVAAARRATELGVSVIVIEKCMLVQARSGDFALMDSKVAAKWGRDKIEKAEIVNALMQDMAYKANQNILRRWADEAGMAFDWYTGAMPEIEILDWTGQVPTPGVRCWIQPRRLPLPPTFDNCTERYKCFQVTAWVRPSHVALCRKNFRIAQESGLVKAYFDTRALKLIREDEGRVSGVIARTKDGVYIQAEAAKGVILATGDYMSDEAMLKRFLPGSAETPKQWTSFDRDMQPSNTGDGHKMAVWAGARIQDSPHAPCAHHMGSVFGVSDFLLLNTQGKRFVNEDAPGQQLGSQIEQLPDKTAWQIIDGNWREYIPREYPNHGNVCYVVEDEELESGKIYNKLCFIDNYVSPGYVEKALPEGSLFGANRVRGLGGKTRMPKEEALRSVERYNAVCRQGKDEDYGKRSDRLFAVEKPPFYAAKFTPAIMIAAMGGIQSDEEARCYDTEGKVIPGLYAAGNVQGNRVAVDYPLTVPGLSHSLALVYGRVAAESAVKEHGRIKERRKS